MFSNIKHDWLQPCVESLCCKTKYAPLLIDQSQYFMDYLILFLLPSIIVIFIRVFLVLEKFSNMLKIYCISINFCESNASDLKDENIFNCFKIYFIWIYISTVSSKAIIRTVGSSERSLRSRRSDVVLYAQSVCALESN